MDVGEGPNNSISIMEKYIDKKDLQHAWDQTN